MAAGIRIENLSAQDQQLASTYGLNSNFDDVLDARDLEGFETALTAPYVPAEAKVLIGALKQRAFSPLNGLQLPTTRNVWGDLQKLTTTQLAELTVDERLKVIEAVLRSRWVTNAKEDFILEVLRSAKDHQKQELLDGLLAEGANSRRLHSRILFALDFAQDGAYRAFVREISPATLSDAPAVTAAANQVVAALEAKDGAALAALAHPDKGVRFSPYGYVESSAQTLSRAELTGAFADPAVRTWGAFDGTGDPIDMTFAAFYQRFVFPADYSKAPQRAFNRFLGHGNSLNNVREAFPGAVTYDFHFPWRDAQYGGYDWRTLRLVFEKRGEDLLLVGIINEQWTI